MEKCRCCFRMYRNEEEDDSHGTGLCYDCFEIELEEFEEHRRWRIAEQEGTDQ